MAYRVENDWGPIPVSSKTKPSSRYHAVRRRRPADTFEPKFYQRSRRVRKRIRMHSPERTISDIASINNGSNRIDEQAQALRSLISEMDAESVPMVPVAAPMGPWGPVSDADAAMWANTDDHGAASRGRVGRGPKKKLSKYAQFIKDNYKSVSECCEKEQRFYALSFLYNKSKNGSGDRYKKLLKNAEFRDLYYKFHRTELS